MSDSGQQVRGVMGHLIDAREALEDYIQSRQHIGPNEINLAAVALDDLRRGIALIQRREPAGVAPKEQP